MGMKYWLAENGNVRCLDDRCPQEYVTEIRDGEYIHEYREYELDMESIRVELDGWIK